MSEPSKIKDLRPDQIGLALTFHDSLLLDGRVRREFAVEQDRRSLKFLWPNVDPNVLPSVTSVFRRKSKGRAAMATGRPQTRGDGLKDHQAHGLLARKAATSIIDLVTGRLGDQARP